MREQINKVKNFGQFLNESINTDIKSGGVIEVVTIWKR